MPPPPALLTRSALIAVGACLLAVAPGVRGEPIAQLDASVQPGTTFAEAVAPTATAPPPSDEQTAESAENAEDAGNARSAAAAAVPDDATAQRPPRVARPAADARPAARPGVAANDLADRLDALADIAASPLQGEGSVESEWERELKEALRPIYDELAASGIVDAVQGIKSYLGLLNALVAHDGAGAELATGDRAALPEAPGDAPRYGAAPAMRGGDGAPTGRTAAQAERERMVAALIFKEWIAAAKPWLFGLLAAYALWQAIRFAVNYSRWKSRRARQRGQRSQGGRRSARRRGASA